MPIDCPGKCTTWEGGRSAAIDPNTLALVWTESGPIILVSTSPTSREFAFTYEHILQKRALRSQS